MSVLKNIIHYVGVAVVHCVTYLGTKSNSLLISVGLCFCPTEVATFAILLRRPQASLPFGRKSLVRASY
jgi:hypothetical protein